MGSFIEGLKDENSEIIEIGAEFKEQQDEMQESADEINSILDSMEEGMSEETREAKESAKSNYRGSFISAQKELADPVREQVSEKSSEIREKAGSEIDTVSGNIDALGEAAGVSEIGADGALDAQSKLEGTLGELEDIEAEAEQTEADIVAEIERGESDFGSFFA